MYTKITYVGKINDIHTMTCGFKDDNMIIEEQRLVLYPEINNELLHKETGERFTTVWLKDNDNQNNYLEVPVEENIEEEQIMEDEE